jgi:hypothetical protein
MKAQSIFMLVALVGTVLLTLNLLASTALGVQVDDTGTPPNDNCHVSILPALEAPGLSPNAVLGFVAFAQGPLSQGSPLNINSYISPVQNPPQPWLQKVSEITFPSVPNRHRFVTIDLDGVGLALKNQPHNNVLVFNLFNDVLLQLSHRYSRHVEFTSGEAFYWLGTLLNPGSSGSKLVKGRFFGDTVRADLYYNGNDFQIRTMDPTTNTFLILDFDHYTEPTTVCEND